MKGLRFEFFVSADWSKESRKRSVYVARLQERRIHRERPGSSGWSLGSLLALARELSVRGRVLIGVDLALGVSKGYWRLVLDQRGGQQPETFVHWLRELERSGEFFETTKDPGRWRVDRPWFEIQSGRGGRTSFEMHVDDRFLRCIDAATGAMPLFAVSGVPGTVGSATRDFWKDLIPLLGGDRDFAIWPFECNLSSRCTGHGIVLAEIYPGLAYAAALAGNLPARRMRIAKTQRAARDCACECLTEAAWVVDNRVDIGRLDLARASEDEFDAHITAAAVLRCLIEDTPLANRDWIDPKVEGSMLLAGPVEPLSKARQLSSRLGISSPSGVGSLLSSNSRSHRLAAATPGDKYYRCPIPGCDRVFTDTRSGWGAHVGSVRMHPDWHPEVTDGKGRKRLFKREYLYWFD